MITFSIVFWTFIVVFGLIGALRGWGKELLVMFSIILALFTIQIVHNHVPPIGRALASGNPRAQFFLWSLVILAFALSGYHIPNIHKLAGTKLALPRDRLQDVLLGTIIGACNGYLLVGTIWFYLDMTGYPFPGHMNAPQTGTPAGDAALKIVSMLPPTWLGVPEIYFAVAIAFAILVIVFI